MTNLDSILDALADALVEKIAARLPPGGQQQTYTVAQLAERYGMSKSSISRRVRAGEFGETINAGTRTHLVTAEGVRKRKKINLQSSARKILRPRKRSCFPTGRKQKFPTRSCWIIC